MKRLFVAGLPYSATDEDLKTFFEECGVVVSAKIILNRDTGKSKGFGFVEFETEDQAKKAIDTLHDADFGGRKIVVKEAKPLENKRREFNRIP